MILWREKIIHSVKIRNYQSLRNIDVELGAFTAIVGPTSSGKSAVLRALRTLASNSRGASYITHGQKSAAVSITNEIGTVTLERNAAGGTYRIAYADKRDEDVFTKLSGMVPDQVTEALGIEPVKDGQSINFAGQFDKPYLIDESGAAIAAKLGELTNVSMIFDAARMANSKKLSASKELKLRQSDLVNVESQLERFENLDERKAKLEELESIADKLETLTAQRARLVDLIERLEITTVAVQQARAELDKAAPPDVDLESIRKLIALRDKLTDFIFRIESAEVEVKKLKSAAASAEYEEMAAQDELQEFMDTLEFCPLCGASHEHFNH